jgi:hypothetical protein
VSADRTPEPGDYVLLTQETTTFRAHWVAGALEHAGIPTFVDEDNLADEFAITQKVMGVMGARVLVPRDRLEEARTVFLGLSQPIPPIDQTGVAEDAEDPSAPLTLRSVVVVVALVLALVAGGVFALSAAKGCGEGEAHSPEPGVPPAPRPRSPPPPRSPHHR